MAQLHLPATSSATMARAIWIDHFRMTGEPFSLCPDPAFLYPSPGHREALAGLQLALWEKRGLAALIGDVGAGKTTVLYALLSNLESTPDSTVRAAYVSNTSLSFDQILRSSLRDLGIDPKSHGQDRLDLLDALNSFLRHSAETGKTVALVIDEAQNLSNETFEELRLLLNFETYQAKLLQIILAGQPELARRLRDPKLRQIVDRIAIRCRLRPLEKSESIAYVEHRLAAVDGSPDVFSKAALGLILRRARGIPRRINVLCHNALLAAYGNGQWRVERAVAAESARDSDVWTGTGILPWIQRKLSFTALNRRQP